MTLPYERALVTGASGFVGASLVEALHHAAVEVHGLVRPTSNRWRLDAMATSTPLHAVDLCEPDALAAAVTRIRPDVVFHAAASSVHHPESPAARMESVRDTVLATASLCEAMAHARVRTLVYLGSSLEYGVSAMVDENRTLSPATFRGASKAAATLLCRQMAAEAGVGAVALRLFSVYGPWESPTRFVPTVMNALATGAVIPLTGPGIAHDFVFVADVVDACLLAAASPRAIGETFNIGSGVATTNECLVETAERVTGVRARVAAGEYRERGVDGALGVADITKAKALLGWTPARSLERGLADTWRWTIRRSAPAR